MGKRRKKEERKNLQLTPSLLSLSLLGQSSLSPRAVSNISPNKKKWFNSFRYLQLEELSKWKNEEKKKNEKTREKSAERKSQRDRQEPKTFYGLRILAAFELFFFERPHDHFRKKGERRVGGKKALMSYGTHTHTQIFRRGKREKKELPFTPPSSGKVNSVEQKKNKPSILKGH